MNFMTTMTDTILQQVIGQVKKTMEAVNLARPLPTLDYVPTAGCEPSHRHAPLGRNIEVTKWEGLSERNGQSRDINHDRSMGVDPLQTRRATPSRLANSATISTPTLERESLGESILLSVAQLGSVLVVLPHEGPPLHQESKKPTNGSKGKPHAEDFKKALHELADKGQLGRFLNRGPRFLHKEHKPACTEPRE
ncbi:LOW QUALITY PROTEIN: hypothetical protein Cgig2_007976 [Carnegiea gigantea]|uniref:Uncharacterized protein n=1 Tax=Carnegiea gigantea TaxID=171969 RepID=A0A9Q1GFQ2_9CARY|nr:LOW QUALITY PROTEIN: hypothetical protein Cgig2_007976 [Carnegiea gigantea]